MKESNIDLPNDNQGESNIYEVVQPDQERRTSCQSGVYENFSNDQQSFQSDKASSDGQRKGSFQASWDRRRKRSFQSGVYEEVKESDDGEYQNLPCPGEGLQPATVETDNIYEIPEDVAA